MFSISADRARVAYGVSKTPLHVMFGKRLSVVAIAVFSCSVCFQMIYDINSAFFKSFLLPSVKQFAVAHGLPFVSKANCTHCYASLKGKETKRCTICAIPYCSKECQRADYPSHRAHGKCAFVRAGNDMSLENRRESHHAAQLVLSAINNNPRNRQWIVYTARNMLAEQGKGSIGLVFQSIRAIFAFIDCLPLIITGDNVEHRPHIGYVPRSFYEGDNANARDSQQMFQLIDEYDPSSQAVLCVCLHDASGTEVVSIVSY